MGDPWERECERIKKGLEELVGDVEERDRLEKAGLPAAVGLTGGIKRKLMQLGEAVGVLAGDLERDASAKRMFVFCFVFIFSFFCLSFLSQFPRTIFTETRNVGGPC